MPNKQSTAAKQIPTGVKIISVLYYIFTAILGIVGVLLIAGAGFAGSILGSIPGLGTLGTGIFVFAAILFIGFAVLYFFIGRGLWKGSSWARIAAIILATLGVLTSLTNLIGGKIAPGIIWTIVNGAIGIYLLFSKQVKEAFK